MCMKWILTSLFLFLMRTQPVWQCGCLAGRDRVNTITRYWGHGRGHKSIFLSSPTTRCHEIFMPNVCTWQHPRRRRITLTMSVTLRTMTNVNKSRITTPGDTIHIEVTSSYSTLQNLVFFLLLFLVYYFFSRSEHVFPLTDCCST